MYIPKEFEIHDKQRIIDFVNRHAFATVVTTVQGRPYASHLPLFLETEKQWLIVGHMAKANEQCQHFENDSEVLVIYQGPHAYISPLNYKNGGVPTWNYTAVHMYGLVKIIDSSNRLANIIETLTNKYEKYRSSPWVVDYPDVSLNAIIGFEIKVESVEAKFKLSQNRSELDRNTIISELSNSNDSVEVEVSRIMRETMIE